jgi:hypothetical protein
MSQIVKKKPFYDVMDDCAVAPNISCFVGL